MDTTSCRLIAILGVISVLGGPGLQAQQKLAQTGMKFLNVGSDARVTAMGEAFTAVEALSVSQFYNPAAMARQRDFLNIQLSSVGWIGDIRHNFASATVVPFGGSFGVFGAAVQFVNYGDIDATLRADNEAGYIDIGSFRPSAYMVGIGYAIELSTKFSVGGNVKIAGQSLGTSYVGFESATASYVTRNSETSVPAFDLGVLYKTGFESLNFGVIVRNFSREGRYEKEGFQLPLIFKIGISMNVFDMLDMVPEEHALLIGVDATHPRDHPEQVNVGMEYVFQNILALRSGYMMNNDLYDLTAGVGFRQDFGILKLHIDYSYTPFDILQDVHRFSFAFTL